MQNWYVYLKDSFFVIGLPDSGESTWTDRKIDQIFFIFKLVVFAFIRLIHFCAKMPNFAKKFLKYERKFSLLVDILTLNIDSPFKLNN